MWREQVSLKIAGALCIVLLSTFFGSKVHALGRWEVPLDKGSKQTRTKFRRKRKEEGREGGRGGGKESGRLISRMHLFARGLDRIIYLHLLSYLSRIRRRKDKGDRRSCRSKRQTAVYDFSNA